jgi:hypothetical protein
VGVADSADIFMHDALQLSSGLAQPLAVEGVVLGIAVGFGKVNAMTGKYNMFNPANLELGYYDDSASTHTEWRVYYVPAEDIIFEAQIDDTAATLVVGEAQDIIAGSGNTTTGLSTSEINGDALTNDGDVVVVEIPDIPDNDHTLAFGRYWYKFVNTQFNNA